MDGWRTTAGKYISSLAAAISSETPLCELSVSKFATVFRPKDPEEPRGRLDPKDPSVLK